MSEDLRLLGIASHPNVNGGAPSLRGVRLVDLLDRIDAGDSIKEVAEDFEMETGSLELLSEVREELRAPQPEGFEHCNRCSRGNTLWHAPSPLWNAVMRDGSINGEPKYNDLVCATCFMTLAEEAGVASRFKVFAAQVNVELETTTPSGRFWDDELQLWVAPLPTQPAVREDP